MAVDRHGTQPPRAGGLDLRIAPDAGAATPKLATFRIAPDAGASIGVHMTGIEPRPQIGGNAECARPTPSRSAD